MLDNYLTNRKQKTKIKNTESSYRTVKTGVPQGSILGPLLFLIFINDLPNIAPEALFTLFADDTVLTISGKNIVEITRIMQMVLDRIYEWCTENKLSLNTSKTEYVIFGSKQKKAKEGRIALILGNELLREVDSYKYLGTIIDSTLNGNKQLAKLNQNIALKMTSFRRMRYFINEKTALMLYKALILPLLDYNDIIYNLLTRQQQDKLQKTQNRALRVVFRDKILSVKELHDNAKLDFLEIRRNKHLMTLMFDRAQQDSFIDTMQRKTRQGDATLLKVPKPQTHKLDSAPVYKGSVMWNALTVDVRKSKTKLQLKYAYSASLILLNRSLILM